MAVGMVIGLTLLLQTTSHPPEGTQGPKAASGLARGQASLPNRLIHSGSPYLLLHAHNPVDWYPWGEEALEKAKREHKPIFLSVGYSTCYWCHVAEKTIYSDPDIAKLMNAWFVNIKVDREERPDLDRVYMLATQILTGHGGWPNNVFLTPDLKPFFAGSYFPPKDEPGRGMGFTSILKSIHEAWLTRQEKVLQVGERVRQGMERTWGSTGPANGAPLKLEVPLDAGSALVRVRDRFAQHFDTQYGGEAEGGGTKFPMSPHLRLLLQDRSPKSLGLLRQQLDAMAWGGIHDHLAGGFHRYATEPTWSIPHFEKMLSDNAQLMDLYRRTFEATGEPRYRVLAEETAAYLRREMTDPLGGFYSAQDAEVEGREGASYLWTEGFLDDYALFGRACLTLFEATQDALWRDRALQLAEAMLKRFREEDGALRTTVATHLLIQPQEFGDDTQPSGLSAAVDLLLRLSSITGNPRYADQGRQAVGPIRARLQENPEAWPSLLVALSTHPAAPSPAANLDSAAHLRVEAALRGRILVVTLHINRGYHVNANPASFPKASPREI